MRRDIEFKTEDGVTLRGWHYKAKGVDGPAPTVIMAHGFTATREIFLDSFANEMICKTVNFLNPCRAVY